MNEITKQLLESCVKSTLYDIGLGLVVAIIGYLLLDVIPWKKLFDYVRGKEPKSKLSLDYEGGNIHLDGHVPNSSDTRSSISKLLSHTYPDDKEIEDTSEGETASS